MKFKYWIQIQDTECRVSLVVTDTNNPPSVEFTISPPDPIVGEQIEYDASESTAPDGNIVAFDWDFGDGTETLVENVTISHTYESSETYTTTMTATDDNGLMVLRPLTSPC